jgi:hypothetical protein
MDEHFWISWLSWRKKNNVESGSAQIKFGPKLVIRREKGWGYLESLVANPSNSTVWVQPARLIQHRKYRRINRLRGVASTG